jgi:hypothetical protein
MYLWYVHKCWQPLFVPPPTDCPRAVKSKGHITTTSPHTHYALRIIISLICAFLYFASRNNKQNSPTTRVHRRMCFAKPESRLCRSGMTLCAHSKHKLFLYYAHFSTWYGNFQLARFRSIFVRFLFYLYFLFSMKREAPWSVRVFCVCGRTLGKMRVE